jgi:hypothetical protein
MKISIHQGILIKGEGLGLNAVDLLVQPIYITFYKTNCFIEEVNRTGPFPSVSVPCRHSDEVINLPTDGADLHRRLVQPPRPDEPRPEFLRIENEPDRRFGVALTDVAVFGVEQVMRRRLGRRLPL